jgi:hypothetical protein
MDVLVRLTHQKNSLIANCEPFQHHVFHMSDEKETLISSGKYSATIPLERNENKELFPTYLLYLRTLERGLKYWDVHHHVEYLKSPI